jgi:integrative and conjugative element protein (TIGR02256 family)
MTVRYFRISAAAYDFMVSESENMAPHETGGLLVGTIEADCVCIEVATGPGPNAVHLPHRFKRDGKYSQEVLDDVVQGSEGMIDYLGEWHSHSQDMGPSILDMKSMLWIAKNPDYHVQTPILLLCIRERVGKWKLCVYVLRDGLLRLIGPEE